MKKREAVNLTWHLVVGCALALAVSWRFWLIVPVTFIYAWLREQAQHRWIITKVTGPNVYGSLNLYALDKETFFGWMTGHRIWEVFQWVIGAAAGVGIWLAIRYFV